MHNDFKLDNLMLAYDDPTRVIAVLDWEMTTVGDPLIDLGMLLTYWTMRGADDSQQNRSLTAVTNGPGWLTREELIEFARKYDPFPFHLDDKAAQATPSDGEENVAHEVVGEGFVIHQPPQPAVNRQTMPPKEGSHGKLIAVGDPPD